MLPLLLVEADQNFYWAFLRGTILGLMIPASSVSQCKAAEILFSCISLMKSVVSQCFTVLVAEYFKEGWPATCDVLVG